jgi:hypothetical protein
MKELFPSLEGRPKDLFEILHSVSNAPCDFVASPSLIKRGLGGVRGVLPRKDRGLRDVPIFSTIVNQYREVQRDHPLVGDLGVSPNPLSTSPKSGG